MSTGALSETVSSQFCWEQILRTNPLFRVSRIFAEGDSAQQLLPLYALFSAVEQSCAGVSDSEVGFRKLEWWREECLVRDVADSDHPILKEFCRIGAADSLRFEALTRLLLGAQARLDGAAPVDMDELKHTCEAIGEAQLELEAGVCGFQADSPNPGLDGVAAQNGLAQLIREGGTWWLPLQVLARHGISRSEIRQDSGSDAVRALFGEVFSAARAWNSEPMHVRAPKAGDLSVLRHALVINQLYARKINRLEKIQPSAYRAELMAVGIPDLFTAWQTARRVSRR